MMRRFLSVTALLACIALHLVPTRVGAVTYTEKSNQIGIDVVIPSAGNGDWGSGVAFIDFDGDGDLDIYVVMGHGQPNRLYENGNGRFTDRAVSLGCADAGNGKGIKFADYDNDGDQDFFLGNFESDNRLFRNDGSGHFEDATDAAGLTYHGRTHGAAWGDYDNDGYLDLYVCNRHAFSANLLYHNNGDGTFEEVAAAANVEVVNKLSMECVWVDFDGDGDQDLYVAIDKVRGNMLFRNEGDGTFSDVSAASGAGVFIDGMGIAVGDYNSDGYEDFYLTSIYDLDTQAGNVMLQNDGDGTFTNVTFDVGDVSVNLIGWGTEFLDYNNDGYLDLYVVNWWFGGGPQAQNYLFENSFGFFVDVSKESGAADEQPGYGCAVADPDGDGYPDIFVINRDAPSIYLENSGGTNNWLKVHVIGKQSNRDGLGARVAVHSGGDGPLGDALDQLRVIRSGSSYLSQSSRDAMFGLGQATQVDSVVVTWPSGIVDRFYDVTANQTLLVREGGFVPAPPAAVVLTAPAQVATDVSIDADIAWTGGLSQEPGQTATYDVYFGTTTPPLFHHDNGIEQSWNPGNLAYATTYYWRVVARDDNAATSSVEQSFATEAVPNLAMDQNFPNPFNPKTTIAFALPQAGSVRLAVYDGGGRLVAVLIDGEQMTAGNHERVWSGADRSGGISPSGVYFYRLETPGGTLTRKMMLLK